MQFFAPKTLERNREYIILLLNGEKLTKACGLFPNIESECRMVARSFKMSQKLRRRFGEETCQNSDLQSLKTTFKKSIFNLFSPSNPDRVQDVRMSSARNMLGPIARRYALLSEDLFTPPVRVSSVGFLNCQPHVSRNSPERA